jgi:hypothetical protein
MSKHMLFAILVLFAGSLAAAAPLATGADNLSGTWIFSVDLDSGGHGDPTFVFKQEADKLTGTYTGPLGEQTVTGTVTGNKAVFGFEFSRDDQKLKATYTGTIEAPGKMTGTVEFTGGEKGKWTATRKSS